MKSKNPTFNHVTPFLFAVLSIVRWCHSDLAKTSDSLHLHSLEWVWMCHRKIPQSLSDHSSDTCINNQGPDDIWWSRWCKALAMESSVVRWWGGKCFTCDQCDAQIPTCLEDLNHFFVQSCKSKFFQLKEVLIRNPFHIWPSFGFKSFWTFLHQSLGTISLLKIRCGWDLDLCEGETFYFQFQLLFLANIISKPMHLQRQWVRIGFVWETFYISAAPSSSSCFSVFWNKWNHFKEPPCNIFQPGTSCGSHLAKTARLQRSSRLSGLPPPSYLRLSPSRWRVVIFWKYIFTKYTFENIL